MIETQKVCALYKKAVSRRTQWEDLWEEIYELMLPMQEGFYENSMGEENMEMIFDETGVVSIQRFASKLQSGLVPNFSNWFRLVPGTDVPPDQALQFQPELDNITSLILETLRNTNFSQATVESFLDVAVGTGSMQVNPDTISGRKLDFTAVSQPSVYILPGPGNTVGAIFRKHTLDDIRDARVLFPKATFSSETRKTMARSDETGQMHKGVFIEAILRDWKAMDSETWNYEVVYYNRKETVFSDQFKGEGANPFIVFRWSNRPGEVYGRGPALLALPAVRVANLVTKLTMENADIQIGGMWQVDDDGTVNVDTIEIASGTVIPRTPGSSGLQSIAPGGRIEFGDVLLSRTQEHIRDIFFSESLGQLDKTPRSATEVGVRTSQLAEVMGSSFGRMQYEFVVPLIRRISYLLKQAGEIELPRVNGREIAVMATSPLARGMKFEEVQNMTNFYGTIAQMVGPEAVKTYVKTDKMVERMAKNFEVPADILTTEEERVEAATQMGEAMGQAEQLSPGSGADVIDMASRLA